MHNASGIVKQRKCTACQLFTHSKPCIHTNNILTHMLQLHSNCRRSNIAMYLSGHSRLQGCICELTRLQACAYRPRVPAADGPVYALWPSGLWVRHSYRILLLLLLLL
ncbi:hypothetical protein COCSUDRAFT_34503 [Coccomyxa subellipsoidea C-169]|uniref:Uncharacterized protein n=1 Tax=Coccomyxa subellipsoidea (strain C-169) TaxID=574566 RepID=I0YJD1_COCSC|nr:hypothetical protein COCSUDRAFT_34503 [Coccomyxa subellipsoidea C-169]EIE18500.1 hypothetical protein COCSUDRAFT_34503 [Coccomyxa subellipsoidea C-169]|eukprot:XP_005643044.1 hypothetical protein COCSUDRAFT_34503 [Coccomyxa subellipsoidea C-169]